MKRFLVLLLLILSVVFISCGGNKSDEKTDMVKAGNIQTGDEKLSVKLTGCNVRKQPIVGNNIIKQVKKGTEGEIIDFYGDWINVTYVKNVNEDNQIVLTGYIWVKSLSISNPLNGLINYVGISNKVIGKGGTLRRTPSSKENNIITIIPAGADILVNDVDITWYKIKLKDFAGWIYRESVYRVK